jgi:riboflavin kinase/FMN adenylyltransferase
VALGVFDGVHLGHQRVIRRMVTEARACGGLGVVVTFDRHPNAVVAPGQVPPLIYCLSQKLRALAELDVDATWVMEFDQACRQQTGQAFIRNLAQQLGSLRSICVGADFQFGYQRSGNVALLSALGKELGFTVHALEPVSFEGAPVSSTRIRQAIRAGQLETASRMLGRRYALAGRVVEGDRLGRQLGFPTANLDTNGLVLPPNGVYAAEARYQAQTRPAVLNVGFRPTLNRPSPQLRVEAHLLDFSGELYGQELELVLVARLREERPFQSLQALRDQIAQDVAAARLLLARASASPPA